MNVETNYDNDQIVTWRLNDHREWRKDRKRLNTTVKAPRSMFPHEVILKVTSREEMAQMELVTREDDAYNGTTRPVIHIYDIESMP